MNVYSTNLAMALDGWNGYQTSLVRAIAPLTPEQLCWRPSPDIRSVGEVARHIGLGRLNWFVRMDAPKSGELAARVPEWSSDGDGNRHIVEEAVASADRTDELVAWLEATWEMIDATLNAWTVEDLAVTYRHVFWGKAYAISRQWTLFRMLAHDIHHGGQLSTMLGIQGIEAFELIGLGGHIVEPPPADATQPGT